MIIYGHKLFSWDFLTLEDFFIAFMQESMKRTILRMVPPIFGGKIGRLKKRKIYFWSLDMGSFDTKRSQVFEDRKIIFRIFILVEITQKMWNEVEILMVSVLQNWIVCEMWHKYKSRKKFKISKLMKIHLTN